MYVVAVCGTKGGVGKTTIAASLAACAAAHGHRSALVDLDPQESLAFWRRVATPDPAVARIAEAAGTVPVRPDLERIFLVAIWSTVTAATDQRAADQQ